MLKVSQYLLYMHFHGDCFLLRVYWKVTRTLLSIDAKSYLFFTDIFTQFVESKKKEFSEQISQYKLLPDHNSNPRINIENWSENKFNTCIQFFTNFILSIPNITPLYFIFLCYATMNIPLVQVYICPILIDYKVLSFWDLINYVCKYEDSKLKYIMTKWS